MLFICSAVGFVGLSASVLNDTYGQSGSGSGSGSGELNEVEDDDEKDFNFTPVIICVAIFIGFLAVVIAACAIITRYNTISVLGSHIITTL